MWQSYSSLAARSSSGITYSADVRRGQSYRTESHAEGNRGSPPAKRLVMDVPRAGSPPSSFGAVAPPGPDILAPSLGATDNEKLDIVSTKLDGVMKEVQAHREEDVVGAEQLRRHDDQLQNHEPWLNALEIPT